MIYKTKPLNHQFDAVTRFHNKYYGALFCEMGTGKTKIMLDILQNSNSNFDAVVVAPNGLHHNWTLNEIPKHIDNVEVYCWKGPIKTKRGKQDIVRFCNHTGNRIFLINIEALRTKPGYSTTEQFTKTFKPNSHFIVDE